MGKAAELKVRTNDLTKQKALQVDGVAVLPAEWDKGEDTLKNRKSGRQL